MTDRQTDQQMGRQRDRQTDGHDLHIYATSRRIKITISLLLL